MLLRATAPASGREIKLNLSFEQCVVFDFVTKDDLVMIIKEYEKEKINHLWDEVLCKEIIEDGNIYYEAFKTKRNNKKNDNRSFAYFKGPCIGSALMMPLRGGKLAKYVQSLCLEGQKHILDACYPFDRRQAEEILRNPLGLLGSDKIALLEGLSSPEEFVNRLSSNLLEQATYASRGENRTRSESDNFDLLVRFWAKGLILLPQNVRHWNLSVKWNIICDANSQIDHTIKTIYQSYTKSGHTDRRMSYIATFFATSTTINRNDLSIELIKSFQEFIDADIKKQYDASDFDTKKAQHPLSDVHKAILCLSSAFNDENPSLAVDLVSRRKFKEETTPRRDIKFGWVTYTAPDLATWADYLYLYFCDNKSSRVAGQITALNHFMDFILTLENPPPSPWLISRQDHITDVRLINKNTFFTYLTEHVSADGHFLNSIISTVRKFYLRLRDILIIEGKQEESKFLDPILETDRLGIRTYTNRTSRDALPPFLILEMKEILVEDDFSFPRGYFRNTVQTIDQESGFSVRVFYPGTAICMYTLLDTPIRSHQARWLDSGLLDEKIYNPLTGENDYNLSPHAIAGRKEGVVQLSTDTLRSESWLSMWVNTNKAASLDTKIGYSIPYISPQLSKLFYTQLEWSKKYLPAPKEPISYRHYMQDVREVRPGANLIGPEITPLFIDPTKPGQKLPIAYPKLKRFYILLLKEAEKRILAKHGHHIKLVTTNENGNETWVVDLHSLRVSGITNLIEAGVPIEVVQQFVAGHKTLVMTLHYLKYSPEKLREFIENAHQRMQEDQDFVGSQTFIQTINEFTPYLLSQAGAGMGAGFEALNSGDGIMVINTDGICPGTSCSTGFVLRDGVAPLYGPVPGGKRCPLCRYWITGPAHLLGQVTAANNLAYSIRKKGLELARLNELKLDAEDLGNQPLARELRDRVDLLNREIELDVAEWAARYKYVVQSHAQMDEYLKAKAKIIATDATPRVPMMTSSAPLELKVTLEQAHEFALLDQITQTAVFNPGFPNLQAELEKHHVLSKMMVANGMKPFLLSLTDEQAREAGNLLSALVLQQVNAQDLDEVLTGKMPLENYPFLSLAMHKLEDASANDYSFLPNALSALSTLIDPSNPVAQAHNNQDDEDLFG